MSYSELVGFVAAINAIIERNMRARIRVWINREDYANFMSVCAGCRNLKYTIIYCTATQFKIMIYNRYYYDYPLIYHYAAPEE